MTLRSTQPLTEMSTRSISRGKRRPVCKADKPYHHPVLFSRNLGTSTSWNPLGHSAVAQWLSCCATNQKVAGSIPASVSGYFIDIKSFRSHYGPGVDSASNINEYQEYFLGGKGGRCVRLTTLPPSCAVVMKSGNLNFVEPSGRPQACNGTALPFIYLINWSKTRIYVLEIQSYTRPNFRH
jgi:hypothetical protein